jgi:hypothetical protein
MQMDDRDPDPAARATCRAGPMPGETSQQASSFKRLGEPEHQRRSPSMRLALLAASALLLVPVTAQAQSLLEGWSQGQITIYGWVPGISGAQEFPDGEPIVDRP